MPINLCTSTSQYVQLGSLDPASSLMNFYIFLCSSDYIFISERCFPFPLSIAYNVLYSISSKKTLYLVKSLMFFR
nr:MAG TPA: hypothetical protein [Caudoviricetes sp.]